MLNEIGIENGLFSFETDLDIQYTLSNVKFNWPATNEKGMTGYKWLSIITLIEKVTKIIENKEIENIRIILDEPERYMHPGMLLYLANKIVEMSKRVDVYMSTHSEKLLNYLLKREDYNLQITIISRDGEGSIERDIEQDFISKNKWKLAQFVFYKKIILVEGINDKKLVEYILMNVLRESVVDTGIIMAAGKIKIPDFLIKMTENTPIYNNKTRKNEAFFKKEDVFTIFDIDKSKENERIECGSELTHKEVNGKILDKIGEHYAFEENLETELQVDKQKFDPFKDILDTDKLEPIESKIKDWI